MPKIQVAHVHEQGQDIIIAPLDSSFDRQTPDMQDQVVDELQVRASAAGLRGTVVPVWQSGTGQMKFIAPRPWHAFFRSINFNWIAANVNREIYW